MQNWENAYLCGPSGITYEPSQEQSVAAVSSQMGLSPFEVVYDHFLGSDGTGCERRLPPSFFPPQKHPPAQRADALEDCACSLPPALRPDPAGL